MAAATFDLGFHFWHFVTQLLTLPNSRVIFTHDVFYEHILFSVSMFSAEISVGMHKVQRLWCCVCQYIIGTLQ
jgi:hypothetical protein